MIEVGEYVRDRGEILQVEVITNIKEDSMYIKFKEYAGGNTFYKSEIKEWKHSENIIDLIEEGDYVNGYYIYEIREVGEWKWLEIEADLLSNRIKENEIKSIVTKEMFASMEYKVKE